MKAAVYSQTGPPEVFRYVDVDSPTPGPGAILVRNEAISIEGGDVLHRAGGELAQVPHIVGYASAGFVPALSRGGFPRRWILSAPPVFRSPLAPRRMPWSSQVTSGELEVVIDRQFPLSEAAAAHGHIEARAAFGRVVLIP